MRKAIVALAFVPMMGCNLQPNFILVMTTFDGSGIATTQSVIQGFRSKEKCEFAGHQWHNAMPWNVKMPGNSDRDPFVFSCLEPLSQ